MYSHVAAAYFLWLQTHGIETVITLQVNTWMISVEGLLDWLQSLKQFFINVSYACSQSNSDCSVLKQSHQS